MYAVKNEMTGRNRTDLLELFRATAAEIAEREFPHIGEATAIADLGIDSLNMQEIIGELERKFRIHIPEESLAGVQTVKDLLNAVESRTSVG
jgi:acyl carrier protein